MSSQPAGDPASRSLLHQWWTELQPQQRDRLRATRDAHSLPDDIVGLLDGSGTQAVAYTIPGEDDYRMLPARLVDLIDADSPSFLDPADPGPMPFDTYDC